MRDYNLRSESRAYGSPLDVHTYHRGTTSGYDEAGSRIRDSSSGYHPTSSIPYQPSTSNPFHKASYAPPYGADPSLNPYAGHDYGGLYAHRSESRRRSPSPSAYADGRRSQPHSQRSYGANDVYTEIESAFPDKQLIVRERDPAERWNPRWLSQDEGHELPVANEIDDNSRRARDREAKVKEEKDGEERRQKAQVEADVLRTIKDFKERESGLKSETKVSAKRLAALALRSRSHSRSRSKAPSVASASVADRRSQLSPTRSTRLPLESANKYSRASKSQPQAFEYHNIDAVIRRREWQDSENSPYKYETGSAGGRDNSRLRRGVRSSTLDTLPGRGILKTGENSRLEEELSDDSISDVYPEEGDSEDSSTESSESDIESDRQHRRATSGGTSELGLDRTVCALFGGLYYSKEILTTDKLTDSPASISSRDSQHHEHLDAGPLPASRTGPGNLRRMTVGLLSTRRALLADF